MIVFSRIKRAVHTIIRPVSKNKDKARREFVLNVLLFFSIILTFTAFLIVFRADFLVNRKRDGNSSEFIFGILALYSIGLWLSKKGYAHLVSFGMLLTYLILVTHTITTWGPDMPVGLLMYALIIVMAGILLSSAYAFLFTLVICAILAFLIQGELYGSLHFRQNWKQSSADLVDAIVYSIIFTSVAVVSWLFNREGERALKRARISEAALKRERDSLAEKVEEKTEELYRQQVEKVTQLYNFAEFGKLSAGLLHDLSGSVNLVSLNLRQIEKRGNSLSDTQDILARAKIGTKRLESFIDATRKQINNQEIVENFSINNEINQVIEVLRYKAKKAYVSFEFNPHVELTTYGNPIKFHQLISNCVSNAIDSYDGVDRKNKTVIISTKLTLGMISIAITDFGKGIAKKNLARIFEPLFTTKGFKKGTGIGLSISQDIIERSFKGTITVVSTLKKGSTFTIKFPQVKNLN